MRSTTTFQTFLLLASLSIVACQSEIPQASIIRIDSIKAAQRINVLPIDTTMFDSLRAIERRSGGSLGVAAIHIESGWRTVYRGDETFPMASVAKLPMALAFLRQLDAGRLRLDSVVTLTSNDHRPGGSRLFHHVMQSKSMPRLHDLLEAMITESDNTAADMILHLAGGPVAADRLMSELGLDEIDVTSYEGELILKWAGIDPASSDSTWTRERIYAKIEAAGKEKWDSAGARLVDDRSDAARPEALARLLVLLQQGKVLSHTSTDTLLAIMSRTVTGKGRIAAFLPVGTPVAHKTGTIGSVANDVGIITLPEGRGHLAVAFLVKGSSDRVRTRDRAIAEAAALIYRVMMKR